MYGTNIVTPNMHFSCHLSSCVLDFGPIHSFWLFSFERYNGILGRIPNNNRSIEIQMMNRFQSDIQAMSIPTPALYRDQLHPLIPHHEVEPAVLSESDAQSLWSFEAVKSLVSLPKSYYIGSLSLRNCDQLTLLYSRMYSTSEVSISSTFHKYTTIKVGAVALGSHRSRSHSSSIVMAEWNSTLLEENASVGESCDRPVRINFFIKHTISIGIQTITHLLVFVSWFHHHPKRLFYGKPVSVWEHDIFYRENFIPIQLLKQRTVSLVDKINDAEGHAIFVSPLLDNILPRVDRQM